MRPPRLVLVLLVSLVIAALGAACGSKGNSKFNGGDASIPDGESADSPPLFGDTGLGGEAGSTIVISPANSTINVTYGQQMPTVTFTATVKGQGVPATFTIAGGAIASIVATTGVMTPTGTLGGTASVTASYQGATATTSVTVIVHLVDNGGPESSDGGDVDGGAGGIGGVGGNGTGGPVSMATQMILQGTPTADPGLAWLYPYDKTVWPRGVLAPLLQWNPPTSGHVYDSVSVQLTEAAFQYQGYFSANASPFVNTLVPAAAWQLLEYSNGGEPVTVTLVFSAGGVAYGPLTETWTIAQGTLTGTVYYNSYGTNLAHNFCCTLGGAMFGGATLAIKHSATSPVLVAGNDSECRVCHSVAAQGATLVTQNGDNYHESSAYALTAGYAETVMPPGSGATLGTFGFAAISPDGTFLFGNTGPLPGLGPPSTSALYSIPSGTPIVSTGLPAGLGAGTPVFSPDGKHVAFNDYSTDQLSLAAMPFTQSSNTFGPKVTLHTPTSPDGGTPLPALFPAFLPTNDAVVFEQETATDGEYGATRSGSRGELWWVDLTTQTAVPLANLNGTGYLPTGANNHADDETLNYEPTVNPVPSGGYAWVVFTSRRMYGNVATIDPFSSDPRYADLTTTPTTKKLWVAAIDLNAKPGTDPSHPAFYLPGQELLACNSRGYWVVDPCEQNGSSCITGDQCCSGTCEDVDGGFVCGTQTYGCTAISNKCTMTSDCCNANQGIACIDGFCSQGQPQ